MEIQDNKKLWFHRRLMTYTIISILIIMFVFIILCILFLPIERLPMIQASKEIIISFFIVCGVVISLYFILTTLHDKNLLPQLIELTTKFKK